MPAFIERDLGPVAGLWDDLQGSILQGAGAAALTQQAYRDTPANLVHMRHDQDDKLTFVFQMPHTWNLKDVKFHLHMIPCADPAGDEDVLLNGYYAWTRPGNVPLGAKIQTLEVTFTGTPEVGDKFALEVNGIATEVTADSVVLNDEVGDLRVALAAALAAEPVTVGGAGAVITVTADDGTIFTYESPVVTLVGVGDLAGTVTDENIGWQAFEVVHTVSPGDAYVQEIVPLFTATPPSWARESTCLVVFVQREGTGLSDTYKTGNAVGLAQANLALVSADVHFQKRANGTPVEYPT